MNRWRWMHRPVGWPGRLLLLLLLALLLWWLLWPPAGRDGAEGHSASPGTDGDFKLSRLMGGESAQEGFLQAEPGALLQFPRDHGQHPGYRNEWWYLTGNLQDRADPQRQFGFQFTLFRFALAPAASTDAAQTQAAEATDDSNNPWLSRQFYMAHFAITDVESGQHRASERFSRQGPGLAGAGRAEPEQPLRFWLANWSLQSQSTAELFPLTLNARAAEQGIGLQVDISALKPRVLQGDGGFSLKNSEGGGSYYYSYPRLAVTGQLQWQQQHYQVQGQAWFDHEWSSNSLAAYQAGWDWFSLQLADGRDLMYYRFRNHDGSPGLSHLLLVDGDGRARVLAPQVLALQVLDRWRSDTGVEYPSGWRLQIPSEGLDLLIEPQVKQQLMALSVRYWEGAVRVSGSHRGRGYVELAGYD